MASWKAGSNGTVDLKIAVLGPRKNIPSLPPEFDCISGVPHNCTMQFILVQSFIHYNTGTVPIQEPILQAFPDSCSGGLLLGVVYGWGVQLGTELSWNF